MRFTKNYEGSEKPEGRHMSKKEIMIHVLKQISYRRTHPTRGDKRFIRVLYVATGCWLLFFFVWLVSDSDVFIWLFYTAFATMFIVVTMGLTWRVYEILKQMR